MGQYWKVVNLDKKEFVHPHELGTGLKLWEQLANHPGSGAALIILCAAMPESRGGGDFDVETNWHGPERVNMSGPGPMPDDYPSVARRTIGRWAGDRIALVGDYAEDGDIKGVDCSKVYASTHGHDEDCEIPEADHYKNITADVCRVIEHELGGKFEGEGWRRFVRAA